MNKIQLSDLISEIFKETGIKTINFDEDGNQINPNDYYYDKNGYLRKKESKKKD